VTYAKGVQTTFSSLAPADELDAEGFPAHMSSGAGTSTNPTAAGVGSSSSGRETEDEMRERIVKELEEEKRVLDAQIEVERARLEAEVEQDRLRGAALLSSA
jgi:dynein intermediate chain